MQNFKKTTLALALSLTLGAVAIAPNQANATTRGYYDSVVEFDGNSDLQLRLIEQMVPNLESTLAYYDQIIDLYGANFGGQSWFIRIGELRDLFAEDLDKLTQLRRDLVGEPTVVDVQTSIATRTDVARSEAVLVSSTQTRVEEISDGMVFQYADTTEVFEVVITSTLIEIATRVTRYSNDTTDTQVSETIVSSSTEIETTEETQRLLVDSYPVPSGPTVEHQGIATTNVLSAQEYLARDDVSLTGSQTFYDAFKRSNPFLTDAFIDSRYSGYGDELNFVGAPDAWARGWTGEGTTIAILDSGIDSDHSEFAGRITANECFLSNCTSGEDDNGHGSHVAGTAAAALDGVGMTGVAPDADIISAKIIDRSGSVDIAAMIDAIEWANDLNATVANLSLGYNFSNTYRSAVGKTAEGEYRIQDTANSTHAFWDDYGFNALAFDGTGSLIRQMEEAMTGGETLLVFAAGNQGLAYSAYPAHYATQTNNDGSLVLGGKVIIAGSFDVSSGQRSSFSNAAGTLCVADQCETSDYRVSDFYLMAPGTNLISVANGGGYTTKSGTSMAAPVISGAAAVVHQMWPHMTGANLAQLLLSTGDKSFSGYDVNEHGQGILDLDAATSPQGGLEIPKTGRAGGATSSDFGALALNSTGELSEALSSVLVVDSFDRDFYIDANSLVSGVDTRQSSLTEAHKDRANTNQYAGFANNAEFTGTTQGLLGITPDGNVSLAYDFQSGVRLGVVQEQGSFLGNVADSDLMRIDGATTAYAGFNVEHKPSEKVTLFAGATVGFSSLNVDDTTLIQGADTLVSNTANVGVAFDTHFGEFGLVGALPVAITQGAAHFQMASDIDNNGDLIYRDVSASLASDNRETNLGLFYNTQVAQNAKLSAFVEHRMNYQGQDRDVVEAGLQLDLRF